MHQSQMTARSGSLWLGSRLPGADTVHYE